MPILPTKVQMGEFGARPAAPNGGTLTTMARTLQPRPALLQRGPTQGLENLVTLDGQLKPDELTRAIGQLQSNVQGATARARANPLANGHLFQNVAIKGPLTQGALSDLPSIVNLKAGFLFFVTTIGIPFFYDEQGHWVDGVGTIKTAASSAAQTYTKIEHGFGAPAVGFLITNVTGGVIGHCPRIVPAGNATDNNIVQILIPVSGNSVKADIYVFH